MVGRGARVWWRRLPADKRSEIRQRILSHRKKFMIAGVSGAGGLVYAYESHVQECPVTGRSRFVALYPDQMKTISKQEFASLLEEYQDDILLRTDKRYDRVVDVSNRLLSANRDIRQIYDKTWTVTVVDQNVQNAFVLPCGNIFVFTGMLDVCDNDDQLAVILGHEMSHAILGHVAEKLTLATFIQMIILVPMAVLWAIIPSDGIALVTDWFVDKMVEIFVDLPFSRAMELEADEVGLQLAAKACFDVREAPVLWRIMELRDEITSPADTSKDLEFLYTHPVHSTRYERLYELLEDALTLRTNCGCSRLPYKQNPEFRVRNLEKIMTGVKQAIEVNREKVANGEGKIKLDTSAIMALSAKSPDIIEKEIKSCKFWSFDAKEVAVPVPETYAK